MNPIDLPRLRDFSDGTEAGLRELAALLITHMDECLAALRRGAAEQDAETIRIEAHRGAGTFGACGAQSLSALLAGLEHAAGELAEAVARLPQIEAEAARVRAYLAATLPAAGADGSDATQARR